MRVFLLTKCIVSGNSEKWGELYPIDCRIYTPEQDGKTKNAHFQKMLIRAVNDNGLYAKMLVFDRWYALVATLKLGISDEQIRQGWHDPRVPMLLRSSPERDDSRNGVHRAARSTTMASH